jgi:hypothetical protein
MKTASGRSVKANMTEVTDKNAYSQGKDEELEL